MQWEEQWKAMVSERGGNVKIRGMWRMCLRAGWLLSDLGVHREDVLEGGLNLFHHSVHCAGNAQPRSWLPCDRMRGLLWVEHVSESRCE